MASEWAASRSADPSRQSTGPALRVASVLLPFALLPYSVPPACSATAGSSPSLCFPAAAALSQMYQGLLLMTFLSVFQIVSNKSIPRKRPREVALSTFQTCVFLSLFPLPLFLLPFSFPVILALGSLQGYEGSAVVPRCTPLSVPAVVLTIACLPQIYSYGHLA